MNVPYCDIEQAKKFAEARHAGQVRKHSGLPYITHPEAVVNLLKYLGFANDHEFLSAAWLHDVVEDCNVNELELKNMFGERITRIVMDVTNLPSEGNRSERWEKTLLHYSSGMNISKILKLADRICNLKDYTNDYMLLKKKDIEFLHEVYLKESEQLLIALGNVDFGLRWLLETTIYNLKKKL